MNNKRHILAALLVACALSVHAAPAVVQGLVHGTGQEAQRFPWVRADDAKAADRINQFLFIETFEAMAPARAADGLRGVEAQQWKTLPNLGYEVLRNDARLLSLRIEGESCGAYCESFAVGHAFDAATGRHLAPADLFTAAGLAEMARKVQADNVARLRKEIAALGGKARAKEEDREDKAALYTECLQSRQDPSWLKMDPLRSMEIDAKGVLFTQGRCSNHALRALDDLGDFSSRFTPAQLAPWLTAYGRALLLGEGTASAPASAFDQVLRGSIDARLPVTLRLQPLASDGSVGGTYFYDRYRKPISVFGTYRDGVLALEESKDTRLRLVPEGTGLRGEWISGQKTLPLVLAP
ncbi:hypothetical protein ACSFBM_27635 [Variovorax sp. GB1R11]|uniref:hypothetical protein n=1 Tax=Variovorax sp. GB1R11 TaxID=3443741 RepID=UPI003F464EA5